MLKRVSSGFRERLRHKPDTRQVRRGPSVVSGFQRLLVMLEGKPFEEILAQPSLGPPACRGGSAGLPS